MALAKFDTPEPDAETECAKEEEIKCADETVMIQKDSIVFEEPDGQTKSGNQSPFSYYQGGNQPGTEILEKNIDADETREIDSPLRITGVATNSTPQTLAQLRSQIDERMRNRVITRRVNRFEKTTTTVVATKLGSVIAEDAEDEEEEETENKSKRANSSKSFSTFEKQHTQEHAYSPSDNDDNTNFAGRATSMPNFETKSEANELAISPSSSNSGASFKKPRVSIGGAKVFGEDQEFYDHNDSSSHTRRRWRQSDRRDSFTTFSEAGVDFRGVCDEDGIVEGTNARVPTVPEHVKLGDADFPRMEESDDETNMSMVFFKVRQETEEREKKQESKVEVAVPQKEDDTSVIEIKMESNSMELKQQLEIAQAVDVVEEEDSISSAVQVVEEPDMEMHDVIPEQMIDHEMQTDDGVSKRLKDSEALLCNALKDLEYAQSRHEARQVEHEHALQQWHEESSQLRLAHDSELKEKLKEQRAKIEEEYQVKEQEFEQRQRELELELEELRSKSHDGEFELKKHEQEFEKTMKEERQALESKWKQETRAEITKIEEKYKGMEQKYKGVERELRQKIEQVEDDKARIEAEKLELQQRLEELECQIREETRDHEEEQQKKDAEIKGYQSRLEEYERLQESKQEEEEAARGRVESLTKESEKKRLENERLEVMVAYQKLWYMQEVQKLEKEMKFMELEKQFGVEI